MPTKKAVSQKGGVINPASAPWLPIADTLHDFGHTGDRNAMGALGTLFTKANLMSPAQWATKLSQGSIDSASLAGKMSPECNSEAKSQSVSFERRVTVGMDNCALENAFTKAITWEDIIRAPSAKALAQSISGGICVLQNGPAAAFAYGRALKERRGKVQGLNITRIAARNKVAHFILEFMFPGYKTEPVGVTYDAAGAKITKIFSNIGQVKAVITPTNVADSASTMLDPYQDFKQYGHKRTEFIFPQSDAEAKSLEPWTYDTNSTFFLSKLRKDAAPAEPAAPAILLHDENFNVNNPNGFKIQIAAEGEVTVNYDTWDTNVPTGPSAPYLATALKKRSWSDARKTTPNTSTIIPLDQWMGDAVHWKAMLVDIKRTGDYEQVNAAVAAQKMMPNLKLILGTGDVLCSTYARLQEQACILGGLGGGGDGEGGHALVLFRFPKNVSPEALARAEKAQRARALELHQKFINMNANAAKNAKDLYQVMNGLRSLFDTAATPASSDVLLSTPVKSYIEKVGLPLKNLFYYWVSLLGNIITTKIIAAQVILANASNKLNVPQQAEALKQMLAAHNKAHGLDFLHVIITSADTLKAWHNHELNANTPAFQTLMKKVGFNVAFLKNTIKKIYDFFSRFPALQPAPPETYSDRRIGSAKRTTTRYITTFMNDKWGLSLSELFSPPPAPVASDAAEVRAITTALTQSLEPWGKNCFQNSFNNQLEVVLDSINVDQPLDALQNIGGRAGWGAESLASSILKMATIACNAPQVRVYQGGGHQIGGAGAGVGAGMGVDKVVSIAAFFTSVNDTIEFIASRCNNILIERMNSYFKQNKKTLILGAYSIFYNLFKVIDRWYNATTTTSIEAKGQQLLIVIPPRDNDFLDSMIGIKQQAQWWWQQGGAHSVLPEDLKQIIHKISTTSLHNLYIQSTHPGHARPLRGARVETVLRGYKIVPASESLASVHVELKKKLLLQFKPFIMTPDVQKYMRGELDWSVAADLHNIWINHLWNHLDILADSINVDTSALAGVSRHADFKGAPELNSQLNAVLNINGITQYLKDALIYNLVDFSRLYNRLQYDFMSFDIISTPSNQFRTDLGRKFGNQNPHPFTQDPAIIAAQTKIEQVIKNARAIHNGDFSQANRLDVEAFHNWGSHIFYIIDLPFKYDNYGGSVKIDGYNLSSPVQVWLLAPRNGKMEASTLPLPPDPTKVLTLPLSREDEVYAALETLDADTPPAAASLRRIQNERSWRGYGGGGKRARTKKRRRRRRNTKRRHRRKKSKRRKRKQKKFTRRRKKKVKKRRRKRRYRRGTTRKRHR